MLLIISVRIPVQTMVNPVGSSSPVVLPLPHWGWFASLAYTGHTFIFIPVYSELLLVMLYIEKA